MLLAPQPSASFSCTAMWSLTKLCWLLVFSEHTFSWCFFMFLNILFSSDALFSIKCTAFVFPFFHLSWLFLYRNRFRNNILQYRRHCRSRKLLVIYSLVKFFLQYQNFRREIILLVWVFYTALDYRSFAFPDSFEAWMRSFLLFMFLYRWIFTWWW